MTKLKLNASILHLKDLRSKRAPLLDAFDILKSNVSFGILTLSESEHIAIVDWYKAALELDEDAIANPPALVSKYV